MGRDGEASPGERVAATLVAFSRWINASYPAALDREARLWRRVTKVGEESGEVQNALRGYLGENPRKGQTHDLGDVIGELLDTAGAALGAVEDLTGEQGLCVAMLANHLEESAARVGLGPRP